MARDEKDRILRVGVIQAGKIVEERLLRKRESVTIGQASRNTFIIPAAQLPKSTTLFELKGQQYRLIFDGTMQGRVSLGNEIIDLKDVGSSQRVIRRGGHYVLPLTQKARGKVVIGDVTLLFQYVDAPPVLAKPQLPASARGGLTRTMDWTFAVILALSFLVQGSVGVGMDIWWRQRGQYLPQQFEDRGSLYEALRAEVQERKEKKEDEPEQKPPEEPEEEPEESDVSTNDAEPEPEPEPEKKPKKKAKASPKKVVKTSEGDASLRKSKRRKEVEKKVAKGTIISTIRSTALGGEGGPVSKLAAGNAKLDGAFDNAKLGVAEAKPGESNDKTFAGAPTAPKLGKEKYKRIDGKGGGKRLATKKVSSSGKEGKGGEKKISARVGGNLGGKSGIGQIDKGSVSKVFRRRRGAIRHCYERALKSNSSVKGKVSIRFTIGTVGRVTSAKVTTNSTGNGSIGDCIIGKVRSWKFPPATGGSVTFTHTFVLSSG